MKPADDGKIAGSIIFDRGDVTFVAAPPDLVSQRNCEDVLGLGKRTYLDLCREYAAAGGVVTALGQLRLCSRVDLVAWLLRRGASARRAAVATGQEDELSPLEKELGLVVVAPPRTASAAGGHR